MVDKAALQMIGITFAALAAATVMVATIVVHKTITTDFSRGAPPAPAHHVQTASAS